MSDLRFALRSLLKNPGFTALAVVTLALGIGANTAIFSFVYGMLFRPLPYPEPDRLVMIWQDYRARGGPRDEWASPANYIDWRAETSIFAGVAVARGTRANLFDGREAVALAAARVTAEYFDVFGVRPALGRAFRDEECRPGGPNVAVISDAFWKQRFNGDGGILGRTVTINDEPHEIVGVMPPGFRPPIVRSSAQVWLPERINPASPSRGSVVFRAFGRLKPGVTLERAAAHMDGVAARLQKTHADSNRGVGIYVQSLHEQVTAPIERGVLVLGGAVLLVLLIACANVANLLLVRMAGRAREFAVRAALGASRGRMVRQLLSESLVLAAAGAAGGLLLAYWAVGALVALAPAGTPRLEDVRVDGVTFVVALALLSITAVLFGLAPALHAARGNLTGALKEGGRGTTAGGGRVLRRVLVVAETAIALMLLAGAGLLLRSFLYLQTVDRGFDPNGVVVADVFPPPATYADQRSVVAFLDAVVERVRALPGVATAATVSNLPLGGSDTDMYFRIEGGPQAERPPTVWYRVVSSDYFNAMRIRLVRGRALNDGDRASAPGAVVINETLARRHWGAADPIGSRVLVDDRPQSAHQSYTVVGVAADVRHSGPQEPSRGEMYLHYRQYADRRATLVVRVTGQDPMQLAGPLRAAVQSVAAAVPVANIGTLAELDRDAVSQPRLMMLLVGCFGVVALALAALGLYGVLAYVVAQRTSEMGIRMALGARPADVIRLVVGQGLAVTAAGLAAGLFGAFFLTRALATLIYGVGPRDALTFTIAPALLLIAAVLASYLPARRASRVDPVVALRSE